MARIIKFRGKGNGYGWVYGDLRQECCIEESIHALCCVDENSIGQFIGLYDANGVEIYEGDIIASGENNEIQHTISYNNNDAQYVGYYSKIDYCGVSQKWINEFNKVIIGNKYDNPELVK